MIKLLSKIKTKRITPEQYFMLSVFLVNGGNYLYNLILGRILGPEQFADAAVLVTFLLVLSFLAMTYQLVTAKFSVLLDQSSLHIFIARMYKSGTITGIILGILIIIFASYLQDLFNTTSDRMFVIFGLGVPFYFIMSVNRGIYQGKKHYKPLSITYQTEMLSRLLITMAILYTINIQSSIAVAIGILISFVFGLYPIQLHKISLGVKKILHTSDKVKIRNFFILTGFYELTQIIINNSDILMVKHYFVSFDAGLYASLALIGRVVYFIAWMFVMLLLPTVVSLKKEGKETASVLFKYIGYIISISSVIVIACFLFPNEIILLLFGGSYTAMAPLLYKYAIATSLFAISNIFAYYYLSLDKYIPVILSGILGMLQIGLIAMFHNNLAQVVHMQIIAMIILLFVQLIYFFKNSHQERTSALNKNSNNTSNKK